MSKRMILGAFFCVISTLTCACGKGGKIENTAKILSESEFYSEEEINEAMNQVMDYFEAEFEGCTLTQLEYEEELSLSQAPEWEKQYDADEVIVLTSSFDVDSSGGDGSFNPNSTYDGWQWILARTQDSAWEIKTYGY